MLENPEMKNQLIDKIVKSYPTFKKDQLDALDTKDLLEISVVLGFNFNQMNKLKAPENATQEVKDLAQNLENIKREREIQDEFKKLKGVRKENSYLTFMKGFRQQNAGKYEAKLMMKEGAKAWNLAKSAGSLVVPAVMTGCVKSSGVPVLS